MQGQVGWFFSWPFNPGDSLECIRFQIPVTTDPSVGDGKLTIYKYACQADAGIDYYAANEATLSEHCPAFTNDTWASDAFDDWDGAFDLYSHTSGRTETKVLDDLSGVASAPFMAHWGKVPAGQVDLTEHPLEGYGTPIVSCGVDSFGIQFFDVEVQGWGTSFAIPRDQTVVCYWYNVPEVSEVDIYITKHACPADYDVDGADLNALYSTCPGLEGVEFVVYDKDAKELGKGVTKSDLGEVAFEDLPAGRVEIVEPFVDDYGRPIVHCRLTDATGRKSDYQPALVASGNVGYGVTMNLLGGETLECEWFNLPDQGEIWITKFFCPEDGEDDYYAADVETLQERCETYTGSDVGFDFFSHPTGLTKTVYGDPDFDGAIWWDRAPVGPLTITEHAQEGYGRPIVVCYDEFDPYPVEVDGWSIDVEVPSLKTEKRITCAWFNIPEAKGSVTVVKYACPEGTGHDEGWIDWYEEHCDEPAEGVSFKLDGASSGNPGEQETDADGRVSWDEREADHYFLYEDVPAGYGKPVVFCSTYYPLDEVPPAFERYDASAEDRIEFDLDAGQHIVCSWFNVPYGDDEPGKLTIYKYWCDGSYVSELNCGLYGGSQKFLVTPRGGGEAIALTTGPNGTRSVELAAGEWALEEVGREWCRAESDAVTPDGYLKIRDGYETVVVVYNCGPGKPPSTPLPTKLPDTGSGDAAVPPALAGPASGAESLGLLFAAAAILALAGLTARRTRAARRPRAEVRPAA